MKELSSIANEKLHDLFERVKGLMRKKLRLEPIFLGKTEPEFIEKFLVVQVQLQNMEFVAPVIQDTIRKSFTHLYLVALKDSGLNIKMWYFAKGPFVPSDMKRVKGIFKRVLIVRELLHLPDNYEDDLTFYVFPTSHKKMLPERRGVPLGPLHCNSGSTDLMRKEIALWRTEEMNKVLVHELLHHYRVDANLREVGHSTGAVLNFDETYTEWLTTILHTMFTSIEKGHNYPTFKKDLHKQIEFALYQAAKVIYHYQMKPNNLAAKKAPFPQETNVYEYYILKAALLYHLSLVLRHVDPNTLVFQYPLEFLQTVMDSLDDGFLGTLDKILSKNLKFTRTLRMVID